MCGIAGFFDTSCATTAAQLQHTVLSMAEAIRHRGPDDGGTWVDATVGAALGFRRLAIIDVSPAGAQPMVSHDGRWVVVFNGEIYNHLALRAALEEARADAPADPWSARAWRGHSDTETLLEAVSAWGVEAALARFNGMFAFALWDRQQRRLYLARDRVGKKPLYYGWMGHTFLFGSELKSLRAHPAFRGDIDRHALTAYLRHNYIPSPYSIYQRISKLPPASFLTLDLSSSGSHTPTLQTYWSARDVAEHGMRNPLDVPMEDATAALDKLLRDAVALRMVADVPLGALLSGGIDSSLVVALMQAQSARPVKTFSIGFREPGYNEADHAKAVAAHLGTDHTELYVSPEAAMAVIPHLPTLYDEPFADSSQIPTFLVSQLARQHVTVALSGDGGDESFGGYRRYGELVQHYQQLMALPQGLRRLLVPLLRSPFVQRCTSPSSTLQHWLPTRLAQKLTAWDPTSRAALFAGGQPEPLYRAMLSYWQRPAELVLGAIEPPHVLSDAAQWLDTPDACARAMYLDTVSYLPDDILVKVDRASMGVSLEARCPLLDYRVIEFAWQLPAALKMQARQGKRILTNLLCQYIPAPLVERPKMGFGVPLDAWLRGPLRDWAEALLQPARLHREGFFTPGPIQQRWQQLCHADGPWDASLWGVLMFQAWLEAQTTSAP